MDVTIPVVLMVAAFYLLVILPTKRRQERAMEIDQNVKPGVDIVTTAGLYGTIVSLDETSFRLEIAPGVTCKFSKAAILRIVTPESEAREAAKAAKMLAARQGKSKGRAKSKPAPAPKTNDTPAPGAAEQPQRSTNGDEQGPKTL